MQSRYRDPGKQTHHCFPHLQANSYLLSKVPRPPPEDSEQGQKSVEELARKEASALCHARCAVRVVLGALLQPLNECHALHEAS